jgi:cytidine deaminase
MRPFGDFTDNPPCEIPADGIFLSAMTPTFTKLFEFAKSRYNPREVSPLIQAGEVSAAILTKSGNIYTGVCIDTASTLGMCAERNAIANMLTNGESKIDKLVCYMRDENGNDMAGSPCGACREYLMQLDADSGDIEILADLATGKTVRLRELIPDWWGERYMKAAKR